MRTQLEIQIDKEEQAKEDREVFRALFKKSGYQPQPRLSIFKRLARLFKTWAACHMLLCCCVICSLLKWAKRIVGTITILLIVAFIAFTGGCARFVLPSSGQIRAFAGDTNSLELDVQTIQGNMRLRRNMDRFSAPSTNASSFTVTPETTLRVKHNK